MRFQIRLFSAFLPILLVGFFLFSLPDKAFSQVLGCCINNGVNCKGCSTGPCQVPDTQCTSPNNEFFPGQSCVDPPPPGQNIAFCEPGPPPTGCCQRSQGDCFETTEVTCTLDGFNFLGLGECLPQFTQECTPPPPTGCCQTAGPMCTPDVTMAECDALGGSFGIGASCTGNICGEVPPIEGCCQTGSDSCANTLNTECSDPFFPGGMCMVSGFCNPPPEGCCVLDVNECVFTTENSCTDFNGTYQGDNVSCAVIEECNVPPEGCCVLGQEDCVVTTESSCNTQNGDYQGDGVACSSVDECQAPPFVSNVPTIGQWGMIAMAGLLGIFSLIIIMRRQRYNVS